MSDVTPSQPASVLILKPSSLGDVVTAVPVLRALRRQFPQAHIAWMLSTGCAPLLAEDPDLNEVILFDRARLGKAWYLPGALKDLVRLIGRLRRGRFEWVLDLQGLFRSGFFAFVTGAPVRAGFADAREGASLFYTHVVDAGHPHTVERNLTLARRIGIDPRREDMALHVPAAADESVAKLLRQRQLPRKGFLVCVPPTRWRTKRYPVRHWRAVTAELARRAPVVLVGGAGDRDLCGAVAEGQPAAVVDLSGRTSLTEMVGVIAAAAGVICSDSAAKFIAPAVGVEAVTLIGPTRVERTGPYLHGRAIVSDVPCQGCLKRRCPHITCMQTISPADVVAAGRDMLQRQGL